MSVLNLEAKLERVDPSTPWGFRMQGGKDFSSALTIQRVNPGSLAAKCGLQVGDIILKIGNISTDILRHKEAQDMIIASGDKLDLLLQRIREKSPYGQRGGQQQSATYEKFNTPSIFSLQNQQQPYSSQQNYNAAPKPFSSGGGSGMDNLSSRFTQGLSMNRSNAPPPAPPPAPAPGPQPPWAQSKPSNRGWQPSSAPVSSGVRQAVPQSTGQGPLRGKKGDAVTNPGQVGRQPMCSSCGNAVRGPFVMAMGKTWCPDHFVCANPQCGVKLIDIGFVEEGGFLYCERDYAQHFAPHCNKCKGPIIGECVNALSGTWHPGCFICFQCKQPIGGGKFHQEDGKPYCEDDWNRLFQTMCYGCDYPIEPGDRWVEAMNKNWHAECFNCQHCQVNLEGQPFFPKGGKPFCKKHMRP